MHPEVESYLVLQSLVKDKTKMFKDKGKEYVASNIDSLMLYKKAVIINDTCFTLYVHHRFIKQIIRLLKQSGINPIDISHHDCGMCEMIHVTQNPDVFIPCLMKFEELIASKKSKEF